jgi:uncharacterized protein (DUF2132 family)
MVTPSTDLSFELKNRTPWLREFVDSLLQSFRRALRIRAGNTLDRVAQQVGDVVLVYLSPS